MVSKNFYTTQTWFTRADDHQSVLQELRKPSVRRVRHVQILHLPTRSVVEVHRRRDPIYDAEDFTASFAQKLSRNRQDVRIQGDATNQSIEEEVLVMSQGTRTQFGEWLSEKKHMTHTAYSRLEIPAKASIYDEYRKSKRKGVPTDGDKETGQKEG